MNMQTVNLVTTFTELNTSKYKYYKKSNSSPGINYKKCEGTLNLSEQRLHPKLSNPDYLVLKKRRMLFTKWLNQLPRYKLHVLDVGGRIQPYRPLLEERLECYVAIDPQLEGLVDTVAIGECLPFHNDTFDLIICTQVLGYVTDPFQVVSEIYRVLKTGAVLLFSVPALFPRHHDERWRFLPEGLAILFAKFTHVDIAPEGYSISGFFRTINVCLNLLVKQRYLRKIQELTLIPLFNLAGQMLDKLSFGNSQFTTNHSVFAIK